jgi:uronate dehydrogenase
VGFHRRERFIDTNVVPRPDTRYGASKVFGEALGRLYADKYCLSAEFIRSGTDRGTTRQMPTLRRYLAMLG